MARMTLHLDGRSESLGAPLLMHNERMVDTLNPFSRSVAELSKKRGRSEVDELELSRREWLGCMYHDGALASPDEITDGELGPFIPVWNVVRSIQEAGKQHKLGKSILRGVVPAQQIAAVEYDGPRTIDELWKDGRFSLRKAVGVGQKRVMRTRPVFVDWQLTCEVEVDLTQIDPDKIKQLINEAGRFQALGDYKPVYGRFRGTAELVDPAAARDERARLLKELEAA